MNNHLQIGINGRVFSIDEPGGAAQVGIKHTANLLDKPVSTTLYGHQNCEQKFEQNLTCRDTLFPVNSQPYGILWERTVLPVLSAKDNLDVLFCPNANAPPYTFSNHKTVLMIHHVKSEYGHSRIQRAYRGVTIPPGVRNADAVVTVSEFSKQKIVELLPVDPENTYVVHNGVDSMFLDESSGSPIEIPDKYILFVGSSDERKNLSRLVKAYNQLETDCELVVVGPGSGLGYASEGVDRDDICNLGYVTKKELKYVYENAALFAYPSLYEGFGLPPLEAAACGTPVVTANVTAMPEVMGDAAEYVDPYSVDSIREGLEIIDQPDRLSELSEAGRKRAEQFTWDKATRKLLSVFEQVV